VNNLETQITKHVNDIIQKYASGLFRNTALEFYGIKTAPIKEMINPEIPVVEVSGSSADVVFLLEDDTYLHFAFETGHTGTKAMLKCAGYDLRLIERDGRKIHSVIIYTSDVKNKPDGLDYGTFVYNPDVILMSNYDGNNVFAELESKIKSGQELNDLDILNLAFAPLMKHTMPKKELAVKSIKLAQDIQDAQKRDVCIVAAVAFATKYLNEAEKAELLEAMKVIDLLEMYVEHKLKTAEEKKSIKIAKNALIDGHSVHSVARMTELDEALVWSLRKELNIE